MDVVSWLLSRKYTDMSIVGLGSIKGANCTIKDIVHQDGINTVTFEWEGTDGTKKTRDMVVYDGTPIYTYEIGDTYHYGDLVIYKMMFYRCIVSECVATEEIDLSCFDPIGTPDGDFGLVQSKDLLPTRFTSSDRKLYFVLDEDIFYYWDGSVWLPQTNLVQYATLPTASEKYLGKIYQYIGTTNANYTHGFIYECISNGETPATYSWVLISGNSLNTLDDVELTNLSDKQILTWDDTNSKWVNEDNNALKQYTTMPTPSIDYLGKIVQYVGGTTVDFINGSSYKCVAKGTNPETYEWKLTMPDADTMNEVLGFNYSQREYTIVSGYYIDNKGGKQAYGAYMYSDPISVKAGDTISFICSAFPNTLSVISICNANGDKINPKVIGRSTSIEKYQYTVKDGEEYIILSAATNYRRDLYISSVNEFESAKVDIQVLQHTNANIWISRFLKRVVCIGDSYTEGWIPNATGELEHKKDYSWVANIARSTGNEWINLGIAGATSKSWLANHISDLTTVGKAQAYVIGLGINDCQGNSFVPLGTSNDIGTDADSYYGYMSKIVTSIIAVNSDAIIFMNTCPSPMIKTEIVPYNQAVRDIVAYYKGIYNINCVDLADTYYDMYNDTNHIKNYMAAHPTVVGHEQIAKMYEYALSDYINRNANDFNIAIDIDIDSETSNLKKTSELPIASSIWLDKTYLLTSDQTGYSKGGIYQCVVNSGVYSWELISSADMVEFTQQELSAMW